MSEYRIQRVNPPVVTLERSIYGISIRRRPTGMRVGSVDLRVAASVANYRLRYGEFVRAIIRIERTADTGGKGVVWLTRHGDRYSLFRRSRRPALRCEHQVWHRGEWVADKRHSYWSHPRGPDAIFCEYFRIVTGCQLRDGDMALVRISVEVID